jgi:hypothetical protein
MQFSRSRRWLLRNVKNTLSSLRKIYIHINKKIKQSAWRTPLYNRLILPLSHPFLYQRFVVFDIFNEKQKGVTLQVYDISQWTNIKYKIGNASK